MNRNPPFLFACILVLLVATPHGAALHCNGGITALSAGGETLYLDDRSTQPGEVNHWLYLESNGIDGLQSGGDDPCLGCLRPLVVLGDSCRHRSPDTLIF